MRRQITRVDVYCATKCIKCKFIDCVRLDCDICENHIERNGYGHFCACLHQKGKEEKTCPFFKEEEK